MKHIRKFNESVKNRGEIRKIADELLGHLHAALLGNIAYDNREKITKCLDEIKKSEIDWDKDVVRSVRDEYKYLMDSIDMHMLRDKNNFKN